MMNEEEYITKRIKELRASLDYEEALYALAYQCYHRNYVEC
tara:strand:+ start:1226 stop:1348 length:123 start_codon:yes stop_codon:yes gene_type:complete